MKYHNGRHRASSFLYYLVLIVGLLSAIIVTYSLFAGLRINFVYSSLINSAAEIKLNVTEARREFLQNKSEPNEKSLQKAWDHLNLADFNINLILEEKEKISFLELPINDVKLKSLVQQLQINLISYRDYSKRLSEKTTPEKATNNLKEWEVHFNYIDEQSRSVQSELKLLLDSYQKIYIYTQYGLIGSVLILTFISLFVFYRSEGQRFHYIKEMQDAVNSVEIGTRKTTIAQLELEETQRKLTTLVNNLPGIVYRYKNDSKKTMEYISDICFLITGYKSEELINNKSKSYHELIFDEDKQKIEEQIQKAVETRKSYQLVYRINTAASYEKLVWEQGVGIFSEKDDELIAYEGFITDITEQKAVQDQLALQSNALEATANGILITDKDGKILWANNAFTHLTGYALKEVVGAKPSMLKSKEHDESYYSHMWATILSGDTWQGEIINKRKNGELYYEEMTITPVINSSGEIINFVSIKQDITERKKAEKALRDSEIRFRGLYENATVGIYRSSPEGKIVMANPTLLKILGYNSFDDLTSINAKEIYLYPDSRELFKKELVNKGRIFGFESQCKKKDGTHLFIRESARLVRDVDGRINFYEGTIEDVTEKKKTEQEIIKAKERAEQSDRLKSEFLAQMSHEIRTPLNVILNFSDIIKEELQEKVDKELQEGFAVIEVEGKRIMRTIELIINMSQVQTGQYDYEKSSFDLYKDVLENQFNNYKNTCEQKEITFSLVNNNGNTIISADRYSVNQIFYHLIDNSVKFTQRGKVEISVGKDPKNNLFVDILDTGIGISDEYMPLLFVPFTKEEQGYTRNFEGNGLGLALAKKYCELNNAEIRVKSIKGKGTAFRVTFFDQQTEAK